MILVVEIFNNKVDYFIEVNRISTKMRKHGLEKRYESEVHIKRCRLLYIELFAFGIKSSLHIPNLERKKLICKE